MHLHNTPAKIVWQILVIWETTLRRKRGRSIHPFIRASMPPDVPDVDYSAMYPPIDHKEKRDSSGQALRFSQTAIQWGLPHGNYALRWKQILQKVSDLWDQLLVIFNSTVNQAGNAAQ